MINSFLMKGWLSAIILLFAFYGPLPAYATEIESAGTPARKLQRGFLNIALSPIELTQQVAQEEKSEVEPTWLFGGMRGVLFMVGRTMVGLYEMATFVLPTPGNYKPIVYPEFLWEYWNDPEPQKPAQP